MARIPISLSSGALKEENLIVGIDLGTTNSLIAKMADGKPQCIADLDRDVMVPSVVYFGAAGQLEVGEIARLYLENDPENTVYSVKRLMGKSYNDLAADRDFFSYQLVEDQSEGLVKIAARGKTYTPVEISSFILRELKIRAEHRLKSNVTQAVITVPAYYNDAQRQATRDAGKLAGLDVLRIINEPTAAALAYGIGIRTDEEKTVAVYDLGGGTFDVTILKIENGIFEVLATNGDTYLGGDDFDRALVNHWLSTYQLFEWRSRNVRNSQQLRLLAEEAKKALSVESVFKKTLVVDDNTIELTIDRDTFERLTLPLVARTLQSCKAALKDAELSPNEIDEVVLVGGSTRQPLVKSEVAKLFGKPAHDSLNPDEVVALGAAIQADILAGNRKDFLLLDVTPLSLGLETAGGLMDVLVPRNSRIPIRVARRYTTSVDGQVNLKVAVYQGERELVEDNRKLAEFILSGIPAMPAGLPKIEIAFVLDADGVLRVEALEERSGVKQSIAVKPSYGLTDEEMEKMLADSFFNAQSDMEGRLLVETRQKARQTLYFAERFLQRHRDFFTESEARQTQNLMEDLTKSLTVKDKSRIQQSIDALEAYTQPFAHAVMNSAVSAAIVGKTAA